MLLYTIVPYEMIFKPEENPDMKTTAISGGYLELIKQNGAYYVSRVISTDPKVYLNPKYTPGTLYKNSDDPGQ